MPIEIKELIIRTTVVDSTNKQSQKQDIDIKQLKRDIVQECMSKLRKKVEPKNSR